jgi:hypothetical protein
MEMSGSYEEDCELSRIKWAARREVAGKWLTDNTLIVIVFSFVTMGWWADQRRMQQVEKRIEAANRRFQDEINGIHKQHSMHLNLFEKIMREKVDK